MPTNYTIPEQRRKICAPCEFHKCTGSLHIRTGGGWREYACTHPDAFEPSDHKVVIELQARAKAMDGGRYIGRTENQPEWCPLLRQSTRETEPECNCADWGMMGHTQECNVTKYHKARETEREGL